MHISQYFKALTKNNLNMELNRDFFCFLVKLIGERREKNEENCFAISKSIYDLHLRFA